MTEIEELRLAYAESSRQKNELLTAHKLAAADNAALREVLWTLAEHNELHFGKNHSTVMQARAALEIKS